MTDGNSSLAATARRERALFRSRRSAIRIRRRTTGPVRQGRNLPGTASGTNEAAPFFDLRERSGRIERQGFEGDRRRMQAHRIGASHEEARNALRLKGSDRGRLDGHEKTRFVYLPSSPTLFAIDRPTSRRPSRPRRRNASIGLGPQVSPDENPPPRIFDASVAAAFLGTDWRRFRPDARKIIHGNLRDSRRTRRLILIEPPEFHTASAALNLLGFLGSRFRFQGAAMAFTKN